MRKPDLVLTKKVYLTQKVYKILRKEKSKQKKSMARLACEGILKTYTTGNFTDL